MRIVSYFVKASYPRQDDAVFESLHVVPVPLHHGGVSRHIIGSVIIGLQLQGSLREVLELGRGRCLCASAELKIRSWSSGAHGRPTREAAHRPQQNAAADQAGVGKRESQASWNP